ncbi:hypothetical protein H2198_002373 [Neophaeococcomyces mojaviensis]|uniref:Uncharacterized protein n=1 Tax=Neophaeococcomyces mojaviensis TaxID=3383035 RepID=A0ACC3AEN7_9EURO|nr:hypothetical protein H2198_002373 [Knufia sp. JES_112]
MSTSLPSTLHTKPPPQTYAILQFPQPYTILIIFNRPRHLNSIPSSVHHDMHLLLTWFDNEPSLRVAIVTGLGRAFCAGADLKEWNQHNAARAAGKPSVRQPMPGGGFAGLSRRTGKKPVIGAVNGVAFGGGMEAVANLDMVVACRSATFSLPEVKRGVVAAAGALPRIVRTVGRMRAMEMALTGRALTAVEGEKWGFVNYVTEDHADLKSERVEDVVGRPVVKKALELAEMVAGNSPDSVIISKAGINAGWEDGSVENATRVQDLLWSEKLAAGENIREGVLAFVEKRGPQWRDSKL